MGRAQRQLRQSQRPGQQNRVETPASDETVAVEVEVETDEEEPRRAPASGSRNDMGGTTTQLSRSKLRILDYMVWNTRKPPPKTVFLRPYIEEVRNASGSRPPLTADGQDEMLEARTVPIDPRGRSPLPRRRRAPQAKSTRLAPTPKYRTGTTTSSTFLPSRQQPSMQKGSTASMLQAQEEMPTPTSGLSTELAASSSGGKNVLPPKPVPKKRPARPAHGQDESGVEFVHEVIQVDPAPKAPRLDFPVQENEVQSATPRAPGDLIASLLSFDTDDKALSGSDQTGMDPPQGKKTKPAARTKFRRSIAEACARRQGPRQF
eukprot:s4116_g7.t1